jgi:hypothetical protein
LVGLGGRINLRVDPYTRVVPTRVDPTGKNRTHRSIVDPNGHDSNKKIHRGPTVFIKNEISWPQKGGGILNIGKWGQILLAENIPKFEQTGLHFSKRGLPFGRLRDRRPLPKSNLQYFLIVAVF